MSIFSAGISLLSFTSKKDDTNRKNGINRWQHPKKFERKLYSMNNPD